MAIFQLGTWASQYQNVPLLDFIGAKGDEDGGDNLTYKAAVKSSPPTNQHATFLHVGCPSCSPTMSIKALKGYAEKK